MTMFMDFEAAATTIRSFQSTFFPGLLRTRECAVALFQGRDRFLTEAEREVRLEVRLERRANVLDRSDPPSYLLVLDEALIHRDIGGAAIFAGQLRQLVADVRAGRIKLRIAPFNVPPNVTVQFPFTVVTMENEEDSVLYLENY